MTTLYGLKNCDGCRNAMRWLAQQDIDVAFVDVRKQPLTADQINTWLEQVDWSTLVNKRSTTWRSLDDTAKAGLSLETTPALLLEHPSLMKRPLLEHDGDVFVGFKPADYAAIFSG
ncbi:MAG: arsenate reductase [Pseudomonadota bacterium]